MIVKKVITLNAPAPKVWDALTNPKKTKQYFFNCEVISDFKPSSPITFRGRVALFKKIMLSGHIVDVEPGKLLKYTLKHSDSSGYSTVTDELIARDGKTVLFISDDVGNGPGAKKRFDQSQQGWDHILGGLKKLIEREKRQEES